MNPQKRQCIEKIQTQTQIRNRFDELPAFIIERCYQFDGRWREAFDQVVSHLVILRQFMQTRRGNCTHRYDSCGNCSWGCMTNKGVPGATSRGLLLVLMRAPLPAPEIHLDNGRASINCGDTRCRLAHPYGNGGTYYIHNYCCPWNNSDGYRCRKGMGEHDDKCEHYTLLSWNCGVRKSQTQRELLDMFRKTARDQTAYRMRTGHYPVPDQAFFRLLFAKLMRAREARIAREERGAIKRYNKLAAELRIQDIRIRLHERRRNIDERLKESLVQALARPIGPSKAPRKKREAQTKRA